MAIGITIRLLLIFHRGNVLDIRLFEEWAAKGATYGPTNLYNPSLPGRIADYPPLLLYVYTLVGKLVLELQNDFHHSQIFVIGIKAPGIIADCLISILILLAGTRVATRKRAALAAGIFFLLPGSWLDSAVWGQSDAIYSGFVFAAFMAVAARRGVTAGIAAGLAVSAKFQTLAYLPALVITAAALDWRLLVRAAIAFAGTIVLVFLPFVAAGAADSVIKAYTHILGAYRATSVNAFNFWWLRFGPDSARISDDTVVNGASYRTWGLGFLGLALLGLLTLVWLKLRNQTRSQTVDYSLQVAAITALLFFVVPTEIHERYLYPYLILAALWATKGRLEMSLYLVISTAVALNIAFPLHISLTNWMFASFPGAGRALSFAIIISGVLSFAIFLRAPKQQGASEATL